MGRPRSWSVLPNASLGFLAGNNRIPRKGLPGDGGRSCNSPRVQARRQATRHGPPCILSDAAGHRASPGARRGGPILPPNRTVERSRCKQAGRREGRGSHLRTRSFPRSRPLRGSPSRTQQRPPAGPGRLSTSCPSSSASVTNAALSTSDDARESVSFSQSHGRSLGRGAAVVPSGLLR